MSVLSRPSAMPSNAQLSALLDSVDEALLLFDSHQRVAFCNRAAQRLFGCEGGQPARAALTRLDDASRAEVLTVLGAGHGAGPGQQHASGQQAGQGSGLQHGFTTLADGTALALTLTLTFSAGIGRVLRAQPVEPAASAVPALPRLGSAATSEAVRLLWDGPQPLWVQDVDFRLVAVNRAGLDRLGRVAAQVLGRDPIEFMPDDERALVTGARADLLAALHAGRQPAGPLDCRVVDPRGALRRFRCLPRWVSADSGAPLLLSILHETRSEPLEHDRPDGPADEIEHWFDLSPIGMLVYDHCGQVLRSNAAIESLVGHTPLRLHDAPADLCRLLAWEGHTPHADLRADAPPLEVRATVAAADGRRLRLRSRLRSFDNAQGQPRVLAVVEDRSLEDERDLAQLEIGALMDTAGVGVATYEASRGWIASRSARPAAGTAAGPADTAAAAHGAARQGGLQSIRREQVEPESLPEFERLQCALREGRRAQVRYAVQVPGLGARWLLTRVEPGELAGGRAALSVVTLDITEQEESHRRSEQLLRELSTILDGTSAGIAYLRGERLVRCNRRFEAMLGLGADTGAGAALDEVFRSAPAAQALVRQALAEDGRFELELARPGGAPFGTTWYSLSVRRAVAAGAPEAVAVLTDVSRLKAQQAELEALARERELMFSLSDVGIAYLRGGRIERANAALARLTGYAVVELAQLPLQTLFEDAGAYREIGHQQQQALQQAGYWSGERRLRRRDGRLTWVQVSKRSVDAADADAGLICSYVDIDERQRAREAVQLQAERTRAILDSVLVGIVTVGDAGIEWMNRSARRMFGGELADFVGAPIAVVATAEPDHPLRATHYRRALADGQAETFECRLRGRDGREFWVVGNAVVTGREPGKGAGGSQITFALLDIERRRQAEISIAQAQASLQRIIDTAPLAIALFDAASARVLRLNAMAAMYFGRPVEALLGRSPEQWFGAADAQALRADLALALAQDDALRREQRRPARDGDGNTGELRVWDVRIVSLETAGQPQLLLVASDVTEQRAAEQARFEAAVAQRDMLVKEVHHRIKNNLQGVAGLLQQTAARRPEVATLIGEAVGQVQAIAQVHGLQVGSAGPLRVKPLLEAITASVQRTFGRPITVQTEGLPAHRFALPEAESIPIALTVNELLTNAVKHSTAGEIRCVLGCEEARLSISVISPGQLRPGFSLAQVAPGVSGLGLVRALLPRRSATLALTQVGAEVQACVMLVPPSVTLLEPL